MRSLELGLCLAVLALSAAQAGNWADDTDDASSDMKASKAICAKAKAVALPRPDPAAKVAKDCDATNLYYGIGGPVDPAAARACALSHVAAGLGQDASDDVRSGPGILATLYANGVGGVARNYDIALGYACQIDGAPAEMDGRVLHLAALKAKGPGKDPFSICDDITSGAMQGYCAEIDASLADQRRDAAIAALAARLTPPQQAALARLRKAADAYVTVSSQNEVDVSGTARGAMILGAEATHRDQFLASLTAALDGKTRPATTQAFATADAALNAAYGKVMAVKDPSVWGTVGKRGITQAERAWIAYRDAFVGFAGIAAPAVSAEAIKTELTRQRIADLKAFLS